MPSEASVARTGICGDCDFRTEVKMPVPQPLSKALLLGVESGKMLETRSRSVLQGWMVRRSTCS